MKTDAFALRHIGPREHDVRHMLDTIGVESIDQLIYETLPDDIRLKAPLDLAPAMTEYEYLNHIRKLGLRNKVFKTYIGLGYHPTIVPAPIQRNIFENPGWYTAYTPYQAEIAQGRLEAMLNFQTMVVELTGMEIANASLLDEGTAAAEAMTLCASVANRKRRERTRFLVADDCHPQTIEVLTTRARPLGLEVVVADLAEVEVDATCFGVLIQYPGTTGAIRDPASVIAKAHASGALAVVA